MNQKKQHSSNNSGKQPVTGNGWGRQILAVVSVAIVIIFVVISMRSLPYSMASVFGGGETVAESNSTATSESSSADGLPTNDPSDSASASASASDSASATANETDSDAAKIAALEAPLTDADKTAMINTAEQTALENDKTPQTLTYCVAGKGDVGSLTGFENTIFRVLNDPQGWPRAGVVFEQVDSNCDFTITLSAPEYMTSFSSGCSDEYSCRVGNDVIINKTRWDDGVEEWLAAGGVMSQYRTMVINHEVGHRLGHVDNETTCAGEGQSAPLMQEQSMSLRGCTPNAWPLDNELWTNLSY